MMMRDFLVNLTLVAILITPTTSIAQTAFRIKKGEPSPIDGIVITEEKAIELYKAEKRVVVLSDLRIAEQERAEFYKRKADNITLELKKSEQELFWYKVGAGVISGLFIYKGIIQ